MAALKARNEMEIALTWDLSPLCADDTTWEQRYSTTYSDIDKIGAFKDKLGESAETLKDCISLFEQLAEEVRKLFTYAGLKHDEDTANPTYQAMKAKAQTLYIKMNTAASFVIPQIIELGQDTITKFMADLPSLAIYRHYMDNLLREAPHILTPDKEQILAMAGEVGLAPSKIFGMINNADMKFAPVQDSKGNNVEITHGTYRNHMENTDRTLRERVFNSYYDSFIAQKNTLAEIYSSSVNKDIFFATVRNHKSSIEASLSGNNIPLDIYKNLIATVNDNLHLMHRYTSIRKKILGLDDMQAYDLSVPLVKDADTTISYEDAKNAILEGLTPMGDEYIELLKNAFESRWVDVYENKNKRSGAYSWGTYGAHPYILMNYTNKVSDMFTLAHEMGHALHSHYTCSTQPFVYGGYTIFLAEIASTVNEALLMNHMLKTTTDKTMLNYLLSYHIDQFRGTLFRQTMFAEFEMIAHEKAGAKQPLTLETLCGIYSGLNDKFFGEALTKNEKTAYEWARIPHFYRAFYVFQYSTGFCSAIAIAKKILEEGASARDRYINLLKSGSKNYSVELLKEAGVDMTTPEPIQAAMQVFEGLLDKFEEVSS
ncbi:MAG: oligoendopeptidase F [Defluviitaleaceae bacterium]|nr:oligoendopeptidase F [Defluviitaleaceae bacterium]